MDDSELRKAWLRGYRQGDVELVVARSTLRREQLSMEVDGLRARTAAMQAEIAELHKRIDDHRVREHQLTSELDEARARRDQLELEAESKVTGIIADAEERALAIKSEGLRQVGELQLQVEQLLALRSGLSSALKRVSEDISDSLDRLAAAPARAIESPPQNATADVLEDPWSSS
jgi:chromosome segregation ATPase